MFKDEVTALGNAAVNKITLMKEKPVSYFILSMMAGFYIGLGIILIFTIGSMLSAVGFAGTKLVMGLCFGIALSLVVMAGAELFTGNNLFLTIGVYLKKVSVKDCIILWIYCWIGNFIGAILLSILFIHSGLASGDVGTFIAESAITKVNISASALIYRGIICNVLVCLALWCCGKMKSESGKLIMIFWCLFAFITLGTEHSIANMTILSIALFNPIEIGITFTELMYNLLFVTLGNMIGGIVFVALPYCIISANKK